MKIISAVKIHSR